MIIHMVFRGFFLWSFCGVLLLCVCGGELKGRGEGERGSDVGGFCWIFLEIGRAHV